jgi:hypothetical protein
MIFVGCVVALFCVVALWQEMRAIVGTARPTKYTNLPEKLLHSSSAGIGGACW